MKHSTTKLKVLTCCIMAYLMPTQVVQSSDTIKSIKEVFVNLSLENASVKEAFSQLEDLTQFKFHYSKLSINNKVRFKKNYEHASVAQILTDIGKGARLAFRQVNRTISVRKVKDTQKADITIEIGQTDVTAVTGTVTDENGEPLVGASVVIKGTSKGTITDVEGKYTINVSDDATLVVSFLGYADQEVMVSGRSIVDVQMVVDVESLDEVVVVGYGVKAEKRDLTGAISSVGAKDLAYTQNHSVDQKLSGMMAGVQVTNVGGKPGAGSKINIRGVTSIRGSNQPLYVIDGVPVVVEPHFGTDIHTVAGNEGVRENPLLGLNADDIERIDVLKDASASSLYGARAANGVILITTKRGSKDKRPEINFSVTTAIESPVKKYKLLDANQYRTYMKRIYPDIKDDYFGDANTDWVDLITNDNALMTKYNLSARGGTEKMQYYLSGSATNHKAILNERLKRYTLRSSIDTKLIDKLTFGISLNFNNSTTEGSTNAFDNGFLKNYVLAALYFRPDIGVYNKDGSYTTKKVYAPGFPPYKMRNPVGLQENSRQKSHLHSLLGNAYLEYEIIENLKIKSTINLNIYRSFTTNFLPIHSRDALGGTGTKSGPMSILRYDDTKTNAFTLVNTLKYTKNIADVHNIDLLLGVSWDRSRTDVLQTTYRGFPDDTQLNDPKSSQKVEHPRNQAVLDALNSIFTRIEYSYRGKYILTLTTRRDGSIRFGKNNKYGVFPSAGVAWVMSEEKFLNRIPQIDFLKLRASIGKTGTNNVPPFTYTSSVSTLSGKLRSFYDGQNGLVPLNRPNPNIRWEETLGADVGIEFGLFNNRLTSEIAYFNKNTSGIITETILPGQTGFGQQMVNYAKVRNWGWEITVSGDIVRNKDFRWNSSVNISFIQNLVVDLDSRLRAWSETIRKGYPVGSLFGHKVLRIAQTQKEIEELNSKSPTIRYENHLSKPGDYILKDANGDGKVDGFDEYYLGKMVPDYFGGWTNRLAYKNVEFSFLFQFVQGTKKRWKLVEQILNRNDLRKTGNNVTILALNSWTPSSKGAYYARKGSARHSEPTSRSVVDASFIRLRSVYLGYTLPKKWYEKMLFTEIKLSIGAENIATITKYPGLDPENGTAGLGDRASGDVSDLAVDTGADYPMARTFSAKLKFTF